MTNATMDLQESLAEMAAEKQARLLLERVVSALEAAFGIDADDRRLVFVLGGGTERTNHEALFSWVWREVEDLDEVLAAQLLPRLVQRLERRLRRWEANQWC